MNPKTLCDQNTKEQLAEKVVKLEFEIDTIELRLKYWRRRGPALSIRVKQLEADLKTEKQKHLDTSNWAMEQQERADLNEAENERLQDIADAGYKRELDQNGC